MRIETSEKKVSRYWWLLLLVFCLVPFVTPFSCGLEPRTVVARIPVGSKLSDLDRHIWKFYDSSSVEEWVPSRTADSSKKPVKNKYGLLYVKHLGEYDSWLASKAYRDAFTGEITFYHHSLITPDDLAPSYVLYLVYIKGILKEKNFGILPG